MARTDKDGVDMKWLLTDTRYAVLVAKPHIHMDNRPIHLYVHPYSGEETAVYELSLQKKIENRQYRHHCLVAVAKEYVGEKPLDILDVIKKDLLYHIEVLEKSYQKKANI